MNPVKVKSKARACIENNQLAEARALLAGLCEKKPEDADAWHLLGAINGMLGMSEQAEICARKVIALQPRVVAAYNNLASSLLAQKKFDQAEEAIKKAHELDPNDPQMLNNTGNLLLQRKQYSKAADYFKMAVRQKPDYAEAHNNLGSALLGLERYDEAQVCLGKALQLLPQYPDALYNYGQLAYQQARYDTALNAYSSALKLQPGNVPSLLGAAEIFKLKHMYSQAANCFQSAIKISPAATKCYVGLGTLFQLQGKHAEALGMLEKALEIDPDCVEALHYAGAYMNELGNTDEAIRYFNRALEVNPDFVQAKHMLASMGVAESPEKADSRYVAELFDAYADNFDEHLVIGLQYRTPDVLNGLLTPLLGAPEHQYDVLDLGCGTGLCAPIFKPWSRILTGVDLSRKMVVKAGQRGLYDKLIVGDLLETLSAGDGSYDLILSADVFVYLGRLDDVMVACARALRVHGLLAFSIEILQSGVSDYFLHQGGRYAHRKTYIEKLANDASLSIKAYSEVVLRKEKGKDVDGVVYVLAKDR